MTKDTDSLITKPEAAARLGLSERAVARHAEAGRLIPVYQSKADGGERVYYSAAEVERLREELTRPREGRHALAVQRRDTLPVQASMPVQAPATRARPVRLDRKCALTIAEAADHSGLGRATLERAVAEGRLAAPPIGPHGARVVRRVDVERLVDELFAPAKASRSARGGR